MMGSNPTKPLSIYKSMLDNMDSGAETDHLIAALFCLCLEAFHNILSHTSPATVEAELYAEWKEERGRFILWGEGFSVENGELDTRLVDSREYELRRSVVVILSTMAHAFERGNTVEGKKRFQTLLEAAQRMVAELDGFGDAEGTKLDPEELLFDVKDSNDSLYDLVPFLEDVLECSLTASSDSVSDEREGSELFGEEVYERNILDKFPSLDERVAERLAHLNWIRHVRIRKLAEAQKATPQPVAEPSHAAKAETETESSGTIISSIYSSIFDTYEVCSTASASSFATSMAEESGQARIPPPPVTLGHGIEFQCSICFKTLCGISNGFQWKKHVLQDIQPYSCIFATCTAKHKTYGSRKEWVAHEFEHRCLTEWICLEECGLEFSRREDFAAHILGDHLQNTNSALNIDDIVDSRELKRPHEPPRVIDCPFCTDPIQETKRLFQKHVGRHFDEIALKTLPLEVFGTEDNELDPFKTEDSASSDWSGKSPGSISSAENPWTEEGIDALGLSLEQMNNPESAKYEVSNGASMHQDSAVPASIPWESLVEFLEGEFGSNFEVTKNYGQILIKAPRRITEDDIIRIQRRSEHDSSYDPESAPNATVKLQEQENSEAFPVRLKMTTALSHLPLDDLEAKLDRMNEETEDSSSEEPIHPDPGEMGSTKGDAHGHPAFLGQRGGFQNRPGSQETVWFCHRCPIQTGNTGPSMLLAVQTQCHDCGHIFCEQCNGNHSAVGAPGIFSEDNGEALPAKTPDNGQTEAEQRLSARDRPTKDKKEKRDLLAWIEERERLVNEKRERTSNGSAGPPGSSPNK